MRAFGALSVDGQARRLREVAVDALRAFDISPVRLRFAGRSYNTVFRVDGLDGRSFALRIGPDAIRLHARGGAELEAEWLSALRADRFVVSSVVRDGGGAAVVFANAELVPGPRPCTLFEWAPGKTLTEVATLARAQAAGRLCAQLHEQSAALGWRPDDRMLVADRVLYFEDDDRLDARQHAYGTLFSDARERAQAALDDLWCRPPHPPHLLHGDLGPANIVVSRRRLVPIDFQDHIWGFDVQDATIAAMQWSRLPGGAELVGAFQSGYTQVRTWPEHGPAVATALEAARHLLLINLGLNVRKPGLEAFVARHATPLQQWMSV